MKAFAAAGILLVTVAMYGIAAAAELSTDPWQPLKRFIGRWEGSANGQAGDGIVARKYTSVLNDRFIYEVSTSRYPPQEKNKSGETHEHWAIFSYDKARKLIVLRQFHVEGFVNTYRQMEQSTDRLVFESEAFENFSNSWNARETYEFVSDDEFIETFELAPPGKPLQVYSRNHLKRIRE